MFILKWKLALTESAKEKRRIPDLGTSKDAVWGIRVSYWISQEAIKKCNQDSYNLVSKTLVIEKWYSSFHIRIAKVKMDTVSKMAKNLFLVRLYNVC